MLMVLLCVFISNFDQTGRAAHGAIPTEDDIARLLDSTIDPCADFYGYVCGSSRRNTSKLEFFHLPGSLQARWLNVKDDISSILEIPEKAGSKASEKPIIAYQSCMKEDSAHDMDSLKELLTDRGMSDWPSRSSNTEEIYDARNDIDLTELEAFFHYDVVQDKHDKSRHMLSLAEAGAGAQRKTAIYTTLRRLNNKYLAVSFSANLLKRNLRKKGIRIEDDTKIYIAEPAYVENVFTLLRKTRRYKVKNYVGWKIIATIAPFVSPLRPHHQKFMAQYGFHEKRKEDICTESVAAKGSALQPLISQLYVERKFSPEAKNDVQLMAQLIQRELVAELRKPRNPKPEATKPEEQP